MSVSQLSISTQNYLKVIWSLQEWSDAPASPGRIAEKTGLHLSTVSGAMPKLAEQGLVEHAPYSGVTLTEAGREIAVAMVRRHRLIETFLVQTLGYGWEQVHDEAEHLEHAVSDFMIERIDALLGHPARDPHGDPIPAADGTVDRPEAAPLSEVAGGDAAGAGGSGAMAGPSDTSTSRAAVVRVRVERISDEDSGLLRHLASRGITVGTRLDVDGGDPYSGALSVVVVGASDDAGRDAGSGRDSESDGDSESGGESVEGSTSLSLDAASHVFVSRV